MTTINIVVETTEETKRRMKAALRGQQQGFWYSFDTRSDLLRTLNPNRWALIEALTGQGPMGVRELARRVDRDVKGVHTDAQALVLCGLIEKTEEGKLNFPYDAVHVDFTLNAAA